MLATDDDMPGWPRSGWHLCDNSSAELESCGKGLQRSKLRCSVVVLVVATFVVHVYPDTIASRTCARRQVWWAPRVVLYRRAGRQTATTQLQRIEQRLKPTTVWRELLEVLIQ